jgi:hypothetical protein
MVMNLTKMREKEGCFKNIVEIYTNNNPCKFQTYMKHIILYLTF